MKNNNFFALYLEKVATYIKKNYPFLILFFAGLLLISALNFMKISTAQTIANFQLSDFEIGQVSDRTIIADRSLSPDASDPVAVIKGEKIIKKGLCEYETDIFCFMRFAVRHGFACCKSRFGQIFGKRFGTAKARAGSKKSGTFLEGNVDR